MFFQQRGERRLAGGALIEDAQVHPVLRLLQVCAGSVTQVDDGGLHADVDEPLGEVVFEGERWKWDGEINRILDFN